MALSMAPSMLAFAPVMPALRAPTQAMDVRMETIADLENLAQKLNPAVGARAIDAAAGGLVVWGVGIGGVLDTDASAGQRTPKSWVGGLVQYRAARHGSAMRSGHRP